ncbi:MAG TPA: oleate hydratase, partial [Rubrivivax sp.]|nr:oleate hydratase [Rubrivivax sp.]
MSHAESHPRRRATLVGGGIAGLAAAVTLIRHGGFDGRDIRIVEEATLGGSLDAGGSAAAGYSMRGSRMYGAAYVLMYELLGHIPTLDDPGKSVAQDTLDFWTESPWDAHARLVGRGGRIVDASSFGLSDKGRADLIGMMMRDEEELGARRIDECFDTEFYGSHFWLMWSSMFGFETWHSAAELRRYLLRFLRLFPDLATMKIVQSTRYNARDSIVRPIERWLAQQGVQFDTGVQVTDLEFD